MNASSFFKDLAKSILFGGERERESERERDGERKLEWRAGL